MRAASMSSTRVGREFAGALGCALLALTSLAPAKAELPPFVLPRFPRRLGLR